MMITCSNDNISLCLKNVVKYFGRNHKKFRSIAFNYLKLKWLPIFVNKRYLFRDHGHKLKKNMHKHNYVITYCFFYTVPINPTTGTNFRGFMIQAQTLADRSPVGAFILTDGDSSYYRLACDNNVRPCSYHLLVLNSILYRLLPPILVVIPKLVSVSYGLHLLLELVQYHLSE